MSFVLAFIAVAEIIKLPNTRQEADPCRSPIWETSLVSSRGHNVNVNVAAPFTATPPPHPTIPRSAFSHSAFVSALMDMM